VTGLHIVRKRNASGTTWYVYAWRGGPCIHRSHVRPVITLDLLDRQRQARMETARRDELNIDRLVSEYCASPEFGALAAATRRDYRLWLDRISQRFGKAPLAAFADPRIRGDIIAWRDTWADRPRTADKASVMMATLLGWAVERAMLPVNHAARIRQLHRANLSDQVWEDRHWHAVRALDSEGQPVVPAHVVRALELASMTGLRLGDLVRLTWAEVGDKAIILTTRKRGGRAVIPVYPELRAWLDALPHRSGPVLLNSRGKAWTESGLETVWQRTKPKEFDRRIHDLRGTYVTWLAVKGLTDEEIARIVGWTAKRIAAIRARYVDEARVVVSLVDRLSA